MRKRERAAESIKEEKRQGEQEIEEERGVSIIPAQGPRGACSL